MELVLTLLAVMLLVVLPVSFLVLMIWGLFYSISRAIRGERKKVAHPADRGSPPETSHEAGTPSRDGSNQRVLK
jgi:hypothetical protein